MLKYTLSISWKIFFGFCSLGAATLMYYRLLDFQSWNFGDWYMFFAFTAIAFFYFARIFDTFSINKEGFEYRSLGITYSGNWIDVKDIDEREHFLVDLVRLEGILISKEKLVMSHNWFGGKKYFFIPLSQFSAKWRESELGYKVKNYLPQVQWKKV